jgi:hypothetical protein
MASLLSPLPRVKVSLTSEPQFVSARTVSGMLRRAGTFGACYCTTSRYGAADVIDVSKRRLLKALRRRDGVWASELFGTIVLGRPEPL